MLGNLHPLFSYLYVLFWNYLVTVFYPKHEQNIYYRLQTVVRSQNCSNPRTGLPPTGIKTQIPTFHWLKSDFLDAIFETKLPCRWKNPNKTLRQPEGNIPWLFTDFEVTWCAHTSDVQKIFNDRVLRKLNKVQEDPRQGIIEYPKSTHQAKISLKTCLFSRPSN